MKRFIVGVVAVLFIVTLLSSCKSKDCPAYGQAEIENIEINS